MKKNDFLIALVVIVILAPFFIFDSVYENYLSINRQFPLLAAFVKFSILATFGEILGKRIKTGNYDLTGFGLLPCAIIWGLLGIWIAIAMSVFRIGVPLFLNQFSVFAGIADAMNATFSGLKLLGAFSISLMMNFSFAPIFMTLHKVTDTHIAVYNGNIHCLWKPITVQKILSEINWKVQWGFVFKKTIPFFWIPAHTVTFILPQDLQVLFAAICGVALGLILAVASLKK